jgi:hypothetical protein
LTGKKAGAITQDQFPTMARGLQQIDDYVGKKLTDGEAQAIELKTSWIDAAPLSDPENDIQVQTAVPKYERPNEFQWTLNGRCFLCHNAGRKPAPIARFGKDHLSHIYFNIIPLPGKSWIATGLRDVELIVMGYCLWLVSLSWLDLVWRA